MRHVATHKYIGCETAADYRVVGRDGFRFRDGSENIKAHHVRHKKRVNILIDKWFPEYTKYELIERQSTMKNGYRTLYKTTMWNGELFCVVLAIVDEERLFIRRIDFQEWEMNRRDGTVECTYVFDKENTSKLCGLLHAQTTADLFKLLKSKFGFRTKDYIFLQNMEDYCMANNIVYHSSVWYQNFVSIENE